MLPFLLIENQKGAIISTVCYVKTIGNKYEKFARRMDR